MGPARYRLGRGTRQGRGRDVNAAKASMGQTPRIVYWEFEIPVRGRTKEND